MTAGLLGTRDPAQPLLTQLDGQGRVELSGSTTANWVAKTANLLVDGHGSPERVGVLLPLHWQAICFLVGAAATGATVVVAAEPADLRGCAVCFTTLEAAEGALAAGVEDVLVVSGHPMGAPVAVLPPMLLDAAREIPGYGDHFARRARPPRFELAGHTVPVLPDPRLTIEDRVLTSLAPVDGLAVLLGVLGAGAALVLAPAPGLLDLPAVVASEGVTAGAGLQLPGLPRLD